MKPMLATSTLAALMLAACSPNANPPPSTAAAPAPAAPTSSLVKDPLLSAVGIGVSDLDVSTKFYTEVMGMKVLAKYDLSYIKEVVVGYPDAESYVVLMHWIDGSKRNYKDLPVKVVTRTKDPAALAAKIKAAGLTVTREPQPSAEVGGAIVGLAKDPDGYVLELLPLRPPPPPVDSMPAPKSNG